MIITASDAARLFEPLFRASSAEKMVAAHLDEDGRVIGTVEAEGGLSSVAMPVRRILEEALRLGAAGVIVAHNHPSGDPSPSVADLEATRRLAATAASVGIQVHDHLVFGGGQCRSLRALGLI